MAIAWPPLWWKDRNWLEKPWLIAAGTAAIYYGAKFSEIYSTALEKAAPRLHGAAPRARWY